MRLTTMQASEWQQVAAYVDTLCLPIYSIHMVDKRIGSEQGMKVERVASYLESKLMGRVLLCPAIPYMGQDMGIFCSYLQEVVNEFKDSGFYHLILIADEEHKLLFTQIEEKMNSSHLQILYYLIPHPGEMTDEFIQQNVENLYQKVFNMWQNQS